MQKQKDRLIRARKINQTRDECRIERKQKCLRDPKLQCFFQENQVERVQDKRNTHQTVNGNEDIQVYEVWLERLKDQSDYEDRDQKSNAHGFNHEKLSATLCEIEI